jgi:glycosyltransferase involved in cell wall biosynthesis
MASPLVSVLLTVYNRERYLAESIDSVLAQSFADFELIVVDDCSTDRSLEIAREYERRDKRIRVIANDRNYGQFPNRNRAASFATAPLFKFHDSDDVMYPHCLAVMVAAMEKETRAGFGLSNGRAWPGGPVPMLLTPRQAYQREFLGFGLFMCGPSGAMFPTATFRDLGGFEDFGTPSDTIFWIDACKRYPVLLLPGDLFYYREHSGQAFRAADVARQYAKVQTHMWNALRDPDCPLDSAERTIARRNLAFSTAKTVWRALRSGDIGLAWHRAVASGLTPIDWIRYLRVPRRSVLAGIAR